VSNLIQLAVVNDLPEIRDDTLLAFTVNGVVHHYTTYELSEVLKTGDPNGKDPGVQALWRIVGPTKIDLVISQDEKRDRGRPKKEELRSLGKTVRMSGVN